MKFLHNISRIEAFSDGVFAFAATLMVVNFDLDGYLGFDKTWGAGFLSFAVSFFVLVALWWLHYNFFRRNNYVDNWIIAINAILLFVSLYYVFPLKTMVHSWLGEGEVQSLRGLSRLFTLYGIGFLLIFACYSGMYYRAYKMSKSAQSAPLLFFYARHFAIFVLVALISILVSVLNIGMGFGFPGIVYGLIGPLCFWHSKWFGKKYPEIG